MKIAFHPAFTDRERLRDRYWRAVHYLGAVGDAISGIDIRTDLPLPVSPPEYLDQALPDRAAPFRERLNLRSANAPLEACDIAIVWDQAFAKDAALHVARQIEVLDPAMLHEGDLWIELGARLLPPGRGDSAESKARLLQHCASARTEIAHAFGTGPSLASISPSELTSGASIVCNSLVKNTALLEALRPAIITAVDPIFHAGASRHAETFRRHLATALRAHPALFVPQARDAHLFRAALPSDLHDRITAVPVRYTTTPNLDLARSFYVTATRNVLTLTLLPLAAQLASCEVRIYGCDGRPVGEADRFWSYDAGAVFADEVQQQRQAHPGFYTLDYQRYYALHCETTRRWIRAIEARGIAVQSATPSHIPALARRSMSNATLPRSPFAFELQGRWAYALRSAQSLYGAALASPNMPAAMKGALRSAARLAKPILG